MAGLDVAHKLEAALAAVAAAVVRLDLDAALDVRPRARLGAWQW